MRKLITGRYFPFFLLLILSASCSLQYKISGPAGVLLADPVLKTAHTGISIFEPATNRYWYNHQAGKYFVPASNTKIASCYAGMKFLGDSLLSFQYGENDSAIFIVPAGDPTVLHRDFRFQPLVKFIRQSSKKLYISDYNWQENPLGSGWEWDDYNDSYDAERSALPVYGNAIKWIQNQTLEKPDGIHEQYVPSVFSEPEVNWEVNFDAESKDSVFFVKRKRDTNSFTIFQGKEQYLEQDLPFVTNGLQSALALLKDSLGKDIRPLSRPPKNLVLHNVYSQPVDSLLRPMMQNSDNFFAEQTLLMVSNKLLGVMNDEKIIDTLLQGGFKDLPQKPYWADGSGLSHYNLFSPLDFVSILQKMKNEFGMKRIQQIFPTGGMGTLKNYYRSDSSFIYAKTGTLAGVITISGYLYTVKNKLLLFSVLVNNRQAEGSDIRKAVEVFIRRLRKDY